MYSNATVTIPRALCASMCWSMQRRRLLAPALPSFIDRCPHIEVDVVVSNDMVDVVGADADAGIRYGGTVNAALAETIKNATVAPIMGLAVAPDALKSGQVVVIAANRANLSEISDKLHGSRILVGRIGLDECAIGLPTGREAELPYVQRFLERAKSRRRVTSAVQRAGMRGVVDK